ncbi:MAG: arylsulfatase, partial [Phycisphaeraceae bacterium]|nr:arylsulfatase [Phycisphaeraceae bacterium]MCP4938179.1 arylsulfatase [Phycisphaeraceae bacterium]
DDPGELNDVADRHPEIVARMTALAASARTELGDSLNEIDGAEIREPMRVE